MLTLNGNQMPSPSALSVALEPVAGQAERAASGAAVVDFLGDKRRLRLKWASLTGPQLRALLEAVSGGFFQAEYPDPVTGQISAVTCWCASRGMGLRWVRDGAALWKDVEMEWMER